MHRQRLPRAAERLDMRCQWIDRVPGTALIDVEEVIAPFTGDVPEIPAEGGPTVVAMTDHGKADDAGQMPIPLPDAVSFQALAEK